MEQPTTEGVTVGQVWRNLRSGRLVTISSVIEFCDMVSIKYSTGANTTMKRNLFVNRFRHESEIKP